MMSPTTKLLPQQAKGSNIIAMDRGYLSSNGNFSSNHKEIAEIGAKSLYWAKNKVGSTDILLNSGKQQMA